MLRSLSAVSRAAAGLPKSITGVSMHQRRHLPVCIVDTNLPDAKVPPDLGKDLTSIVSVMLNKPVKTIQVIVKTGTNMVRGGTADPACHMNVWSIDVFSEATNPAYAKAFVDFLVYKLKVPRDRVTIYLHPIDKHEAAHRLFGEDTK